MGTKMEIEHSHLLINNLNLHIAQIGKDKLGTVIFLHGFPEIWYSWRHQMVAVAEAGYRAISPDWRGYGLSDQPQDPENACWAHLISDLLGLLGALSISKEPGRAEADFGRFDVKQVVRTIYILFSKSEFPIAPEGKEIMDLADLSTPLPEWFTEEDASIYASLYEKNGFTYPLQIPYRAMNNIKGINVPPDLTIHVPVLLIQGEKDYVYKHPWWYQAMKEGIMQKYVRDMEISSIPEGCHFVQEQFPDQVNQLIISFVKAHSVNA
ncbi:epoxide hydrolase 1-like isoform X6 [Carex rostrata]